MIDKTSHSSAGHGMDAVTGVVDRAEGKGLASLG